MSCRKCRSEPKCRPRSSGRVCDLLCALCSVIEQAKICSRNLSCARRSHWNMCYGGGDRTLWRRGRLNSVLCEEEATKHPGLNVSTDCRLRSVDCGELRLRRSIGYFASRRLRSIERSFFWRRAQLVVQVQNFRWVRPFIAGSVTEGDRWELLALNSVESHLCVAAFSWPSACGHSSIRKGRPNGLQFLWVLPVIWPEAAK